MVRSSLSIALLVLAWVIMAHAAQAEERPLPGVFVVERPLRAITPHVLGAEKRVQLESELLSYNIDNGGSDHSVSVNTMMWRVGVTETHEAQLTLESFKSGNKRRNPGIGDTTFSWKKKIAGNPDRGWSWGVKGAIRFPTGAESADERRLKVEVLSPLSWSAREGLSILGTVGAAYGRGVDTLDNRFTAVGALGAVWNFAERFYLAGDLSDEMSTEGVGYNQARVMTMVAAVPAAGFRLDLGGRVGLTPASEDLAFFLGLVTAVGD